MQLRVWYADGDYRETDVSLWRALPQNYVKRLDIAWHPIGTLRRRWITLNGWSHLWLQTVDDGAVQCIGFRVNWAGRFIGRRKWVIGPLGRHTRDIPIAEMPTVQLAECLHRDGAEHDAWGPDVRAGWTSSPTRVLAQHEEATGWTSGSALAVWRGRRR